MNINTNLHHINQSVFSLDGIISIVLLIQIYGSVKSAFYRKQLHPTSEKVCKYQTPIFLRY